jgi:hypothetical protein
MNARGFAIGLAVVLVTSLPLSAQTRQGGCVRVVAGSDQKNGGAFDSVFSATGVLDIDLGILLTPGTVNRFSDVGVFEFRIFGPTGALYESKKVPFTSDPSKRGKPVNVEGYPHPMPLQELKSVSFDRQKHFEAWVRMPVAGTPIINNSLYGTWTVAAYINGDNLPCAADTTFEITP